MWKYKRWNCGITSFIFLGVYKCFYKFTDITFTDWRGHSG